MTHYIAEDGAFQRSFKALALTLPWQSEGRGQAAPKYEKAKVKYCCGECGAKVWGKPGLQLGCMACNTAFSCAA